MKRLHNKAIKTTCTCQQCFWEWEPDKHPSRIKACPNCNRINWREPKEPEQVVVTVHGLTPRQSQVLILMEKGLRNKQIAHELGISVRTVEFHRALITKMVGVNICPICKRLDTSKGV